MRKKILCQCGIYAQELLPSEPTSSFVARALQNSRLDMSFRG